MALPLSPNSAKLIEFFASLEKGTRVPRDQIEQMLGLPWEKCQGSFQTARRVLLRDHGKVIALGMPHGSGDILICSERDKVELEGKLLKSTRNRTRRGIELSESVDFTLLEHDERNTHAVHQFVLKASRELYSNKAARKFQEVLANNDELRPTEQLLTFLAGD
jgi:hypothetical protein